jgi:hypothetical protein
MAPRSRIWLYNVIYIIIYIMLYIYGFPIQIATVKKIPEFEMSVLG